MKRCWFGHSKYTDGSWFTNVLKCNNCNWVESQYAADRLDKERAIWDSLPPGTSFEEGLPMVARALNRG